MRVVLFTHSVVSDWSHGNAHFLRGLARALQARGHEVVACEQRRNWSVENLFEDHGHEPIVEFARRFPDLQVVTYTGGNGIVEEVDHLTRGAELVIVHEFNDPRLVGAVGQVRRRRGDFALFFHDTHHRTISREAEIAALNLGGYDGVLAFGQSLVAIYRERFGREDVWCFHEAADTTVFYPREEERTDDVVWIGNWGDEERTGALNDYLIDSARLLPELRFAVHGVRYPEAGRRAMEEAGIEFRGWIANYAVPDAFARAKMTLHIPRGPYTTTLPGIPTIRPFEALACGIPLVSTRWNDAEGLFRCGTDLVMVESPRQMREELLRLSADDEARARLASNGLETIRARHTCDHRAEQLLEIVREVGATGADIGVTHAQFRLP